MSEYNNSLSSYYHCSAEWHLWRLKDSGGHKTPFAAALYPFAFRISKNSNRFYCSAEGIAEHFGTSPDTVRRAMNALTTSGFFIVIDKEYFHSTIYRVVSHDDWAKAHPESCVVKAEFPWSGEEGDQLGVRLYTASGGRVKSFANILAALRKTGFTDDQIVEKFELFLAARRGHGASKSILFRFQKFLQQEFRDVKAREIETTPA